MVRAAEFDAAANRITMAIDRVKIGSSANNFEVEQFAVRTGQVVEYGKNSPLPVLRGLKGGHAENGA